MATRLTLGCLVLASIANSSAAHAPLARGLRVDPETAQVRVEVPGFGVILGGGSQASHRYACAGLIGLAAGDQAQPRSFAPHGRLVVGSATGITRFAPGVCALRTATGSVVGQRITILTSHPTSPMDLFAIGEGDTSVAHHSSDGGDHWEALGTLPPGAPASGMRVVPSNPPGLYVTRPASGTGTEILVSDDGGEHFEITSDTPLDMTLLEVEAQHPWQAWAVTIDGRTREAAILRQRGPAAHFEEVLRIRFFGGLAVDRTGGRVWVGDEAGGVFRSEDSGDVFDVVSPETAVACLEFANDRLWACTPGLPEAPAVMVSNHGSEWTPVLAFSDVSQHVACHQDLGVPPVCQRAWLEWQSDVLDGVPLAAQNTTQSNTTPPPGNVEPGKDAGAIPMPQAAQSPPRDRVPGHGAPRYRRL